MSTKPTYIYVLIAEYEQTGPEVELYPTMEAAETRKSFIDCSNYDDDADEPNERYEGTVIYERAVVK